MSRSWKLSLVFVSSLALGTFANAQLAVNSGARGQAVASVSGNAFYTPGTLNPDGTVHGGFNDGVRFVQPSPSSPDGTAAKAGRKAQHTAHASTTTAVNTGLQNPAEAHR